MVMAKSQVRGRVESENAERQKKIAQLQDFVARFGAGTRASQVQSRKKEIEKLQVADLKKSNIERPFIQVLSRSALGQADAHGRGADQALARRRTSATTSPPLVNKGEKVAIVGANGVGKTTLCRMLVGELAPDAGTIEWGHEVSVGYIAQDHGDSIPKDTTVDRVAALVRPQARVPAGHPRPARQDALQGRGGAEADRARSRAARRCACSSPS